MEPKKRRGKQEDTMLKQLRTWFLFQYENQDIALWHHSPNENLSIGMAPEEDEKDKAKEADFHKRKIRAIQYNRDLQAKGRQAGFPDIQIIHNKKIFFIELKTPTGVLSKSQKALFEKMKSQGFEVFIARSFDQGRAIIESQLGCHNL